MKIFHNSRDINYRTPFGAVKRGTSVSLFADVYECENVSFAKVRLWLNGAESFVDMDIKKEKDRFRCFAEIKMPDSPCLLWYCFLIEADGETNWYLNTPEKLGGIGVQAGYNTGDSYQITVYDKDFKTPDWFKGEMMYQIFPDRFYGEHENGEIPKKREEYIIHYDRYEPFSFNNHPYENGPAYNDFYGGNLRGITKKLPYIRSLGVGVIYLNPIFSAYSNHKYDTADYMKIDEIFGNEEDFSALCSEAEKLGIKIILDGVFSHTGTDSIYFNKYKNFGEGGAYNDENSPYRCWYQFKEGNNYESWWGCSNLPNVNEMEPTYLDYILRDENSVIKKWLRLGASGWRLDVADELPDEFIKILRTEAKKVKEDAVIIGEVWEDASNKVAYSKEREYLLGYELDSVMNYPFKDNVTEFIMGRRSAEDLDRNLMSILENYPKEVSFSLMNLLGTHDTMRIKSLFGGYEENCGDKKLSSGLENLAIFRLKCALFIQMTYVGVPSVYYGDEIGMEGGRDPYNRAPFDWRNVDIDLLDTVKALGKLRNEEEVLKTGFYKTLYAKDGVWIYARYFKEGKDAFGNKTKDAVIICGINRDFAEQTVSLDASEFGMGMVDLTVSPVGYTMIKG